MLHARVGEYEQLWDEDEDAVLRFLRLDGGPWQVCTGMVLEPNLVRAVA
ncbi:hypothetical protein IEE94_11815 [Yimella sp. cx-573]|nr:hypothetical protein [Yimella sp. cx-573]